MKNKKIKIITLLNKSIYELNLYKKHKRFTNLSQACEKVWVAFNLMVEYKLNREITKGKYVKPFALQLNLGELYYQTRNLHIIHYEGSPAISDEEVIEDIEDSVLKIKILIRGAK